MRQVNAISGWRVLLLWPLAILLRLWSRTLRISMTPEAQKAFLANEGPRLVLFWHNRLFIAAECFRRFYKERRVCGLVSASKDGAWLAAFFRLVGIEPIRGSSSFRGAQALQELMSALEEGADVAITPDGPRGPCYRVAPGAIHLARKSGCALLLGSCKYFKAWRLKSWDGFFIPLPFSKVRVCYLEYRNLDALGDAQLDEALQAALLSITEDD